MLAVLALVLVVPVLMVVPVMVPVTTPLTPLRRPREKKGLIGPFLAYATFPFSHSRPPPFSFLDNQGGSISIEGESAGMSSKTRCACSSAVHSSLPSRSRGQPSGNGFNYQD